MALLAMHSISMLNIQKTAGTVAVTAFSALAFSAEISLAQAVDPSLLAFCNKTAREIKEYSEKNSSSSSSGGLGVQLPIKGIPVGFNGSMSDQFSSTSLQQKVDSYTSQNCDSVMRYMGQVVQANAVVESTRIMAQSGIIREKIRATVDIHKSNNELAGVKDTNSTTLAVAKDTNATNLAISKNTNKTAERISASQLTGNLMSAGVGVLGGILGGIVNNSGRAQERALELQAQRERLEQETRLAEAQRYQQLAPQVQPTYTNVAYQPVSTNVVLNPADVARMFGLALDPRPACIQSNVVIKLQDGRMICAFPAAAYPSGLYMMSGNQLVPIR
jgi:hypothetical protein